MFQASFRGGIGETAKYGTHFWSNLAFGNTIELGLQAIGLTNPNQFFGGTIRFQVVVSSSDHPSVIVNS